jgi:hypothetical protein
VSYGSPVSFTGLAAGSYTIKWIDVLNPSCSGTQQYVFSNLLSFGLVERPD